MATRGQLTPGRWLDCGPLGPPNFEEHVYIHEASLREAARDMLGWQPPTALKERDERIAELQARLDVLTAERDDLRAKFDAIDLLGSEGYRARKKPGRPVKEAVS
ncbi:MAG TPA: hypothetical protein VNC22_04285 [Sporichthya sp.]|nr:hypothetical protein [Sporichthya sp.]